MSCPSAGNCSAGGSCADGFGYPPGFVDSEAGGMWGTAEEVPGTANLTKGGDVQIASVSCASAGKCSAGGSYLNSYGQKIALVIGES